MARNKCSPDTVRYHTTEGFNVYNNKLLTVVELKISGYGCNKRGAIEYYRVLVDTEDKEIFDIFRYFPSIDDLK